jgi:hypothetical protein
MLIKSSNEIAQGSDGDTGEIEKVEKIEASTSRDSAVAGPRRTSIANFFSHVPGKLTGDVPNPINSATGPKRKQSLLQNIGKVSNRITSATGSKRKQSLLQNIIFKHDHCGKYQPEPNGVQASPISPTKIHPVESDSSIVENLRGIPENGDISRPMLAGPKLQNSPINAESPVNSFRTYMGSEEFWASQQTSVNVGNQSPNRAVTNGYMGSIDKKLEAILRKLNVSGGVEGGSDRGIENTSFHEKENDMSKYYLDSSVVESALLNCGLHESQLAQWDAIGNKKKNEVVIKYQSLLNNLVNDRKTLAEVLCGHVLKELPLGVDLGFSGNDV